MAKQSGSTKASTSRNPKGFMMTDEGPKPVRFFGQPAEGKKVFKDGDVMVVVNKWAEPYLEKASTHTKIEAEAVVKYKDVVDPSDAHSHYIISEDLGDRVRMKDVSYSTALGPSVTVALKKDLKLIRRKF